MLRRRQQLRLIGYLIAHSRWERAFARILARDIAKLPLKVYRRNDDGSRTELVGKNVSQVIVDEIGPPNGS